MTEVEPIIVWLTMPAGGLPGAGLKEEMEVEADGVSETSGGKLIYFKNILFYVKKSSF